MAGRQLTALAPSARNLALVRRRVRLWKPPFEAVPPRAGCSLRWRAGESLPRRQPFLFLANHSGFFDPPIMVRAAGEAVTILATESNFREGPIGRFFVHFGAVPKMKYTADARAIITLKRWADAGAHVGLFPEGERTWDGRRLPLVPGIEKLVRLLGLPLVTMRIYNGFRQSPRWAPRLRRGRIHVELDPPRQFDRRTPPAEIKRYIEERITVDALGEPRFPVAGGGLAQGIANVAWACPCCYLIDGLREQGSRLQCRGCGARWGVDWDGRLRGRDGAASLYPAAGGGPHPRSLRLRRCAGIARTRSAAGERADDPAGHPPAAAARGRAREVAADARRAAGGRGAAVAAAGAPSGGDHGGHAPAPYPARGAALSGGGDPARVGAEVGVVRQAATGRRLHYTLNFTSITSPAATR